MLKSSIRRAVYRNGSSWRRRRRRPGPECRIWASTASTSEERNATPTTTSPTPIKPMDLRRVYKYLQLESFTEQELQDVFERIRSAPVSENGDIQQQQQQHDSLPQQPKDATTSITPTQQHEQQQEHDSTSLSTDTIDMAHLQAFLLQRIQEMQQENGLPSQYDTTQTLELQRAYAQRQALKLAQVLPPTPISQDAFTQEILKQATAIDFKRTTPIAVSMLLVGSSVGIITPVMPFVVENLGLSPGQYGMVVSAFALAKMGANVPSAILVERHGRKPYLVYSLSVIALGVGGIGLATSFQHLWVCRLLTGVGVAALSTAATLTISDISTPRNRASTMAPIMSAFAAGTALGPAIGGLLADSVGIHPTFYLVGVSYLGLTVVNHVLLTETQATPIIFPWQDVLRNTRAVSHVSVMEAVTDAVGQWGPLMSNARVRNVVIMNGFYWVALAGAQMTLLPLMLTDPDGLSMTATGVGQVYMGMSVVQVLGNPILGKLVDRIGKIPSIVAGCSLIATSMGMLPYCTDMVQLAGTLGVWATGSTMLSTAPVAYISDTVDDAKRAQAIALLRTSGDVGFLLGATGMGALADWTGDMNVAMETSAGVLLTATGWFATRQYLCSKEKVLK